MNNDIFEKAFDAIDDELIADAKNPSIRIAARRKKIMLSSIAACIAAVLVAIPSIKILSDPNGKISTDETTEIIEEIVYEDENSSNSSTPSTDMASNDESNNNSSNPDIQSKPGSASNSTDNIQIGHAGSNSFKIKMSDLYFTNISTNEATTTYEKTYTPDIKYLYINQIPTEKKIAIYKTYYEKQIDVSEACALADNFFPKLAVALNINPPEYNVQSTSESVYIQNNYEEGSLYNLSISQSFRRTFIGFGTYTDKPIFFKENIVLTLPKSDEEIIKSLSNIKENLFNLFEVSFENAKVIREYGDDYDAIGIDVIFYNSSEHPLNYLQGRWPYSDFLALTFLNVGKQNTVWSLFSLNYASYRTSKKTDLIFEQQVNLLPLEKAEEYLKKGYVLATGGCTLCQSEQTPVDFTDYDYVSFEYKGGSKIGDLTIPYYAFYKNIGTAPNGNMTFAKTYVPAVAVEGYEEYFINKHASH